MNDTGSHYDVLGVPKDASQEEIKQAFFKLVRKHPPEQDPDAYQRLREAYDVLSDPVSRREYDTMAEHGDEIETLREQAETILNQEQPDVDEAIRKLKRATVLGPDISLLRNMLGNAYLIKEKPEDALRQFDKAVDLNPENESYHVHRGYALRALGLLQKADQAFRSVWETDKGNYAAARGLAGVFAEREQFGRAHEVLDQAIWADDTLNFEDFFCYYDKLHLYVAEDKTEQLEDALDTVTEMAETPDDRRYAAFMLAQTADDLYTVSAFGLSHRFAKAAQKISDGSIDLDESVAHAEEMRELEESIEVIMDSDRYHESLQQMIAVYYGRVTGAMTEQEAERAAEDLAQDMDNLMQADPDHLKIKSSLRSIRFRHPKAFELNPEFFDAILDAPGAKHFVDDCPHCGEPVMAEKGYSSEMRCPHCNRTVYSSGKNYYTSRRSDQRQPLFSDLASDQSKKGEGASSSERRYTGGGKKGRSKRFECKRCSRYKYKDKEITGTKCPSCGREMELATYKNRTRAGGSSKSESDNFRSGKSSKLRARSCIHEYDYQDVCRKCGWSRSELKKIDTGSTSRSDRSNGEGDDCFVATAVYGDIDHPDVCQLRRFRDETLHRSTLGRAFIAWYYRYGPSLAEHVEERPAFKRGIRWVLEQFVENRLR
jgi:tetratricopeptide (TPR) repeat protein